MKFGSVIEQNLPCVSQKQTLPIGAGGTNIVVKTEIKEEPLETGPEEELESDLTEEADDQANISNTEVNRMSFVIDTCRFGFLVEAKDTLDVFVDTLDIRVEGLGLICTETVA